MKTKNLPSSNPIFTLELSELSPLKLPAAAVSVSVSEAKSEMITDLSLKRLSSAWSSGIMNVSPMPINDGLNCRMKIFASFESSLDARPAMTRPDNGP